ncbi:MAG: MFS transporter [Pseudomonadota bacterium]
MTTTPVSSQSRGQFGGRAYVLAILTLVYTFNHIDRQVLLILIEPIKEEFALSDFQLGLLGGLAFAAFYATLGIPIAMWADRGNRKNILAMALALWSGMTALAGLAQNFFQLLLARTGVAVGEAGGTPPSTSIISDLYGPKERAFALGIYTSGIGLGIFGGFAIGGLVEDNFGWRAAFFVAGVPGLVLAAILYFTVKEPLRGAVEQREASDTAPIGQTFKFIFGQSSLIWLLIGCALICVSANAFLYWTPSLLQRSYGLDRGDVAIPLGILIGGAGGIGAILLGRVCDRLSARNLSWRPWMIALCAAAALPFAWLFLQAPTVKWAYAWNVVPSFIGLIYASIAYTASQELVGLRMRATSSAFTLFCLTLIGIGGGPTIAGALADYFEADADGTGLKSALQLMLILNALSILALLMSARTYKRDAARAAEMD